MDRHPTGDAAAERGPQLRIRCRDRRGRGRRRCDQTEETEEAWQPQSTHTLIIAAEPAPSAVGGAARCRTRVASRRPMSITVSLPDGKALELLDGATGADAAAAIGPGLARAALAVEVIQRGGPGVRDLARPLPDGASIAILTRAARGRSPSADPPRRGARAGERGDGAVPGREDLDRAGDRAGLLLRLRVPRRA